MIKKTFPDIWALTRAREAAVGDDVIALHRLEQRSRAWGETYGTCIPLLASALAVAPLGPVLELGSGNFSTPLLNEMCGAMERKLVTLETDLGWMKQHADLPGTRLSTENTPPRKGVRHLIAHVPAGNWAGAARLYHPDSADGRWALVFIDQLPDQSRGETIRQFREIADVVVVHDTINPYFEGVDDALASFKYRRDYTSMCPTTTVVSMTHPYLPAASPEAADSQGSDYPMLTRRGGPALERLRDDVEGLPPGPLDEEDETPGGA